jgi:hypothetical protein
MMPDIVKPKSSIDVIVCWPNSIDFPLWRKFIKEHLDFFNKVIIAFTETNSGIDYTQFVQEALLEECVNGDKFVFLFPETGPGEDWRNVAVNAALEESNASWVWFTEQDLFVLSPSFWSIMALRALEYDAIGYKEGSRVHPACLFVKREFINKTGRNFGIVEGKLDHFGRFYFDLRHVGAKICTLKYNDQGEGTFYHMNGLSHNLSLIQRGEDPNHKVGDFIEYLKLSLLIQPQDPRYKKMCDDYAERVSSAGSN